MTVGTACKVKSPEVEFDSQVQILSSVHKKMKNEEKELIDKLENKKRLLKQLGENIKENVVSNSTDNSQLIDKRLLKYRLKAPRNLKTESNGMNGFDGRSQDFHSCSNTPKNRLIGNSFNEDQSKLLDESDSEINKLSKKIKCICLSIDYDIDPNASIISFMKFIEANFQYLLTENRIIKEKMPQFYKKIARAYFFSRKRIPAEVKESMKSLKHEERIEQKIIRNITGAPLKSIRTPMRKHIFEIKRVKKCKDSFNQDAFDEEKYFS